MPQNPRSGDPGHFAPQLAAEESKSARADVQVAGQYRASTKGRRLCYVIKDLVGKLDQSGPSGARGMPAVLRVAEEPGSGSEGANGSEHL